MKGIHSGVIDTGSSHMITAMGKNESEKSCDRVSIRTYEKTGYGHLSVYLRVYRIRCEQPDGSLVQGTSLIAM
jgi:hypothetical protein